MHASKSSINPSAPIIVLKSIFKKYDTDRDGLLNSDEFGNALEDLGIVDETEQRALFALADSNNRKKIHLNDLIKLIKSNEFELILSSRQDYEFVIETYKAFQSYDQNDNGQITWDQFYWYLTKHGYSHQYISQYWYYMDTEHKLCVTFEGFWKGFKAQANAVKQSQLQQEINHEIMVQHKRKHKKHSKILNPPSLLESHSFSVEDENNIFEYMKSQLKPTKIRKSAHALPLGCVLDSNDYNDYDSKAIHGLCASLRISCHLDQLLPSRLPDIIANSRSPLHAVLPSFEPKNNYSNIRFYSQNKMQSSFVDIECST
eukprot:262790_1